jgi:hypothetical protein
MPKMTRPTILASTSPLEIQTLETALGSLNEEAARRLLDEQAELLRECRAALDDLLRKKPMMSGMECGSTSLGNLRSMLYAYRPQGVFGGTLALNVRAKSAPTVPLCLKPEEELR